MLSYDDSKRLKELGYPQELKEGDRYYLPTPVGPRAFLVCARCNTDGSLTIPDGNYVKVPTTDGMIEGPKKAFSCFHTLSINIFDGGVSVDFILVDPVTQFLSAKITGFGDSVEQALCSVWKERKQ